MLLPGLLLLPIIFVSYTQAVWYKDVISPKGWDFGDGMVFHIEDTKIKNSSFIDRIVLRVDYGNVEVSAVPKPEKEAVQLDFFVKDQQEGRSSKKTMGTMMVPFFLGTAKGIFVTMLLSGMKLMALKSLLLAKVAVIISAGIIASKYFKQAEPYYVEPETSGSQHLPVYEFPDHNAYSPYQAYVPSAADAVGAYATVVEAGAGENETSPAKQFIVPAAAGKRRDQLRKKLVPTATVVTIKQYSRPESLL